jgi:hypothetical protein
LLFAFGLCIIEQHYWTSRKVLCFSGVNQNEMENCPKSLFGGKQKEVFQVQLN